jgi:DNA phosphorothioation-associated putative methyltransferase
MTPAVPRYRTALVRRGLSRPLTQAITDQLLDLASTVFDYGCGRGDDLRHLASLGITAAGWDPVHRPHAEHRPADLVNLGYVINVIEDPAERADALRRAWTLARRVLVVSARLTWDARDLVGRPLSDGIITRTGTFQKFYEHTELASWIGQVLEAEPLAAAPGIFYVFHDPADAQQFLANRVTAYRPRINIDPHAVYQAYRDLLAPLTEFLTQHARPPRDDEMAMEEATSLRETFGSLGRACQLIRRVTSDEHWAQLTAARQDDLLVYIGLSRFGHRPRASQLPVTLARDIRAMLGSYQEACAQADRLLFATGKTDLIDLAACSSAVGKLTPTALYVHRSALPHLPRLLRLYEGCARVLAGTVDGANIIKLSVAEPQVSYLAYPGFERDAHPALSAAVTVNLGKLTVTLRDYSRSENPPVIHRKEEFVVADHPRRPLWEKLTRTEIRAGLYGHPERIGTLQGWQDTLTAAGVTVQGHRLRRNRSS